MSDHLQDRGKRPGVSFQSRITGVAMLTAVAVLLAACGAFMLEQWRAEKATLAQEHRTLVRFLAAGDTMRRALNDPASAAQITAQTAAVLPEGSGIVLEDARGRVVASADVDDPAADGHPDHHEVAAEIAADGKVLGRVVLHSVPPAFSAILPRYLALAFALFFAATGLSLFLGRWLAGRVTKPVNALSLAMHEVAESGDFAQKVERSFDDELGRLTDAFNDLLSKLDVKDRDLHRTMDELVDARDAAQAANRLKSQFLANMSHEIRTPLNGLLAMTQVMALEDLAPVQRERLDVIRHSGQALLAILNDVLDVSKIEAGKLELEIGEFDTEEVVRGAYAAFTAMADKKGLAMRLAVEDGALGVRLGDGARLRQILSNLISNALKFTARGEVQVTVRGEGAGGAEGLRLEVSDTGIGIAPEALPLLFQKFTQADSSTTRRFGGTGLGLAICHDLAEMMGGRIWVDSVEGRGSTFHVVLPMERTAEAAPAPAPAPAAAAPPPPQAPAPAAASASATDEEADERPLQVLAAEDNATNQLVLKTVMGIFGVDLTMVENGRQAVDAWAAGAYDLILMDIQMPEMDGLTATRMIRAAEIEAGRPRIPIIALSAHAMTHQVKEYLEAGIDLHVPKPIELPKLQAALEQVMTAANDAAAQAAA